MHTNQWSGFDMSSLGLASESVRPTWVQFDNQNHLIKTPRFNGVISSYFNMLGQFIDDHDQ